MPVWRYLSFDKFVNFLIHREIQFMRASLFTDQNEMRLLEAPKGEPKITRQRAEQLEKRIRTLRDTTFVSCWSFRSVGVVSTLENLLGRIARDCHPNDSCGAFARLLRYHPTAILMVASSIAVWFSKIHQQTSS